MAESTKLRAYDGEGKYIFVSYAHKDIDIVYPFIEALQEKYNVWFDEGLYSGEEWVDALAKKLEECSGFIFMMTDNSLASQYCKNELNYAFQTKRKFVNVMVEKETVLPKWFDFQFNGFQMFDYYLYSTPYDAVLWLERKCKWLSPLKNDSDEKATETEINTTEELYQKGKQFFDNNEYDKAAELYNKAAKQSHAAAQIF